MLVPNSARTTVLPAACHRPMDLARVPEGMASQSHSPNTAVGSAPAVPATIFQNPTVPKIVRRESKETTSKTPAVVRSPSGNTTSIG
jgi:hypothetical protein